MRGHGPGLAQGHQRISGRTPAYPRAYPGTQERVGTRPVSPVLPQRVRQPAVAEKRRGGGGRGGRRRPPEVPKGTQPTPGRRAERRRGRRGPKTVCTAEKPHTGWVGGTSKEAQTGPGRREVTLGLACFGFTGNRVASSQPVDLGKPKVQPGSGRTTFVNYHSIRQTCNLAKPKNAGSFPNRHQIPRKRQAWWKIFPSHPISHVTLLTRHPQPQRPGRDAPRADRCQPYAAEVSSPVVIDARSLDANRAVSVRPGPDIFDSPS